MVICPSCQSKEMNGTLFCSECGTDLVLPETPTHTFSKEELAASSANSAKHYDPETSTELDLAAKTSFSPRALPAPVGDPDFDLDEDAADYKSATKPDTMFKSFSPSRPTPPPPSLPLPRYNPSSGYVMPNKTAVAPRKQAIRDDLRLIVLNSGRVLECPDRENVILGRFDATTGERPEIDLTADNAVAMGVSRRHACLTFKENLPYLADLGAKNHTFLNRKQMQKGQSYQLHNGDEVRLGNVILKVLHDPDGLL